MVAALFAALTVAVPSPQPAADAGPIRTVVYNISLQRSNMAYVERYNDFQRLRALMTDAGTATVDVMVRTPAALGIRVTEITRQRGYPAIFTGNVAADGSVGFPEESINEATWTLLRFFGERLVADKALNPGDTWKTPGGEIAVRTVQGRRVTLEITESFKIPSSMSELFVRGTIIYEPGLLVPISGDVMRKRVESHPEGTIELIETVRFERTSDSFDKPVPF